MFASCLYKYNTAFAGGALLLLLFLVLVFALLYCGGLGGLVAWVPAVGCERKK
jgi:hypothetical protein